MLTQAKTLKYQNKHQNQNCNYLIIRVYKMLITLNNTQKKQNLLIYCIAILVVISISSILPVLPDMAKELHIAYNDFGIIIYSFTLPGIIFSPLCGILSDRFGRKIILIFCLFFFTIGCFFSSFAQSINELVLWRIVQGIGASAFGVLYPIIIADIYTDQKLRLRVMSYANTLLSIGLIVFPALGGFLGEVHWRWSLRIPLLSVLVIFLTFHTPLPQQKKNNDIKKYIKEAQRYILNINTLLFFGMTFCAFSILYGPIISYFPLFAQKIYNTSASHIGIIFASSSLGTIIATLCIEPMNKKFSTELILCIGSMFFIFSTLLFFLWPTNLSYIFLFVPIFCYGIGQGLLYTVAINSFTALIPNTVSGILMAMNGIILRLAQSISPFICGILFFNDSFSFIYFFGVILSLCLFMMTLYIFFKNKNIDIY